jgi:hypothetical protein
MGNTYELDSAQQMDA